MAEKLIRTRECDLPRCTTIDGVKRVRISVIEDGTEVHVDLCGVHMKSESVTSLVAAFQKKGKKEIQVVNPEDIPRYGRQS